MLSKQSCQQVTSSVCALTFRGMQQDQKDHRKANTRSAKTTTETLYQEGGWPEKSVVSPTLTQKLEQYTGRPCLRISQTPLPPEGFQVQLQTLWNGQPRGDLQLCCSVCSSFLSRRWVGVPQLLSRICFRKNLEVKASNCLHTPELQLHAGERSSPQKLVAA